MSQDLVITRRPPETVSPSEVEQAGRCETAHFFGNGLEISPLWASPPLQTGNALHELLAAYYEARQKRLDYDTAFDKAMEAGGLALSQNKYFAEHMLTAKQTFERYVESGEADYLEWEIVAVEYYLEYEISDGIAINGAIDLVVRILRASKEMLNEHPDIVGKLAIVDHKSCYNFWTAKEVMMHVQIPKYIFAVNQSKEFGGEKIEYGIINMIRTRSDAKQVVSRKIVKPTLKRQTNVINEHLKVSQKIIARRHMSMDRWASVAEKVLAKDICGKCDFAGPCNLLLEGASETTFKMEITQQFRPKDTRYREERKQKALAKQRELEAAESNGD